MPSDLAKRLEPIVAEAVSEVGFELDGLEVQQAGRKKLVKVVVDSDDGVGLDAVASASRAVSQVLDGNDHLIEGAYTLEVTSPGLGRPLTKQRHWLRAKHRLVRVTPTDGAAFLGRVGHVGYAAARLLVGSEVRHVAYEHVSKAVVEVEFKPAPAADLAALEADETEIINNPGNGENSGGDKPRKAKRKKEESR